MSIKRQLNEKDVLKLFGIPSFRHMTKEMVTGFVSSLSDMDPEVAKKALEQFPDLSAALTEMIGQYKAVVADILAGSDGDTRLCLETCSSLIGTIQSELENGDVAQDQREYLIDTSLQLVQTMREIDHEGKRFRAQTLYLASVAFGFVVAALVSTLGNRSHVALPHPN